MDESKFCSECGRSLDPGMQFCPQCGMIVKGSEAEQEFEEKRKQFSLAVNEGRRMWLVFIIGIYAIPVIIAAAWSLIDASSLASTIWSSDEFQNWISSHGYSFTEADIKNYITYASALALGSGACALVSLIMIYTRKSWLVAVVACFIAAFLCFWSIFGLIIGILVAWMILSSKDLFVNGSETAEEE